jgi:hypothetical protein
MIELAYYFYLALLALTSIVLSVRGHSSASTRWLYAIYSAPLVVFTAVRPFYLMRDDEGYLYRFAHSSFEEVMTIEVWTGRDPLWPLVISSVKLLWNDPRSMLIVSAVVLAAKLYLLYRIASHNKLLILFMYSCIFWPLHDLTQLRASMAVMFFLLFIHMQSNAKKPTQFMCLLGSFASHAEALPTFLLIKKSRSISPNQFVAYLASILALLLFGLYPDLSTLSDLFLSRDSGDYLYSSYEMYHLRALAGNYEQFRDVPVILIISLVVYGFLAREIRNESSLGRVQLAFRSIALGATLAFLFAAVSDVQVRFYEFFFVAGLVLAGMVRTSKGLIVCYCLALCYFAKFNLSWSIWVPQELWRPRSF